MRAVLASTRDLALETFISRHLVAVVRGALERVGRVYQRMMAFRAEADGAPTAA